MADDLKGAFHRPERKTMTAAERRRQRKGIDPSEALDALTQGDGSHRPAREVEPEIITEYVEPEGAIVPSDEPGVYRYGEFVLTPIGMMYPEGLSEQEWLKLGDALFRLGQSIQWLIGDWINNVHRLYGYTYDEWAKRFGYDKKTLQNYAWVASSIEFSLRKEVLSFGHHNVVAGKSPEEQQYWLESAAQGQWSVARLRAEMNRPVDEYEPPALASSINRTVFNRMWKKVSSGQEVSRNDIAHMRRWLDEVERSFGK
jgi:hypothetical protein